MLIVRARCIKKFVDPWANMAFTFLLMRRRLPSSIVERNPFKRKIFLSNFICKDSRLLDYLLFSVRVIFSRWKFSEKLKRKDYLYWIEFRIFFKYSFLRFPMLKNTFFFSFSFNTRWIFIESYVLRSNLSVKMLLERWVNINISGNFYVWSVSAAWTTADIGFYIRFFDIHCPENVSTSSSTFSRDNIRKVYADNLSSSFFFFRLRIHEITRINFNRWSSSIFNKRYSGSSFLLSTLFDVNSKIFLRIEFTINSKRGMKFGNINFQYNFQNKKTYTRVLI